MTVKPPKKRDRGTAYLLERIPPELYREVRARCEQEGRPLRWLLLRLLALYAAKGLDALERAE
jgi:hypothetical protein